MLLLPPTPRPPTSSSAAGAAKRSVTARSPGTSVGSTESSSTCQTTVPNVSGWSTAMSAPNWSRSSSSANAPRRVVAGAGRGQRTNGGPLREQDTVRVVTLLQPRVRCTAAEPTKRRGKDSHGPTAQHPRSGPARPPMVGASRRARPACRACPQADDRPHGYRRCVSRGTGAVSVCTRGGGDSGSPQQLSVLSAVSTLQRSRRDRPAR